MYCHGLILLDGLIFCPRLHVRHLAHFTRYNNRLPGISWLTTHSEYISSLFNCINTIILLFLTSHFNCMNTIILLFPTSLFNCMNTIILLHLTSQFKCFNLNMTYILNVQVVFIFILYSMLECVHIREQISRSIWYYFYIDIHLVDNSTIYNIIYALSPYYHLYTCTYTQNNTYTICY